MDVAHGELVEAELNRLIEKRSTREPDPDEREELWRESARAYEKKRRQMARLEWHAFHCGQAERMRRTLEDLITHHEEQAQRLLEDQPEGAA